MHISSKKYIFCAAFFGIVLQGSLILANTTPDQEGTWSEKLTNPFSGSFGEHLKNSKEAIQKKLSPVQAWTSKNITLLQEQITPVKNKIGEKLAPAKAWTLEKMRNLEAITAPARSYVGEQATTLKDKIKENYPVVKDRVCKGVAHSIVVAKEQGELLRKRLSPIAKDIQARAARVTFQQARDGVIIAAAMVLMFYARQNAATMKKIDADILIQSQEATRLQGEQLAALNAISTSISTQATAAQSQRTSQHTALIQKIEGQTNTLGSKVEEVRAKIAAEAATTRGQSEAQYNAIMRIVDAQRTEQREQHEEQIMIEKEQTNTLSTIGRQITTEAETVRSARERQHQMAIGMIAYWGALITYNTNRMAESTEAAAVLNACYLGAILNRFPPQTQRR